MFSNKIYQQGEEIITTNVITEDGEKNTKKPRKKWSRRKKVVIAGVCATVLLIISSAIIYGHSLLDKATIVFEGNPADILFPVELKRDLVGRSNVLIFGTSEDDEGHSGALLADSIMVLSVNQDTNHAFMVSVPRDLWVDYGMACSAGYKGKVNAMYLCGLENNNSDPKSASTKFAGLVSQVLDIDIQYYVSVNYSVVREITDAVGGIDVDVYSSDPRGLYDVRMNLKLPQGASHLSGEQALALTRARNSKGGYGLPRSNFDREINQQRVLKALKKQAVNVGVLTNPSKAMGVVDSLGNNIRTNITMSEFRRIIDMADKISDIESIDISPLVKTGTIGLASVVVPRAGQMDYSQIQALIKEYAEEGQKQ